MTLLASRRASQVAGFAAVIVAAVAFIGWFTGLPLVSNWGLGFTTVKPTTALCFAALGLVLVHPGPGSRFAVAVGLTVAAIGALDLVDLFDIDFGINRLNSLLVPQAAAPEAETSFRMINGVPVGLALTGSSLALSRFERHRFAATALAGSAGVMLMFGLLNYLAGSRMLYGTVALPTPLTTIGLLCVTGAIILRIGTIPEPRKPRPLSHLLTVLGCAVIVPVLMFGVYTGIRITDAELRGVQNKLMSEARTLSADVDREIAGEIERLVALAASPFLRQGDFAEFQRQAEASVALRQSGNIALIDRNMQQLVNTSVPFGTSLGKVAVPESVERALATGKPQITGLFTGPTNQKPAFAVIAPVQIGGKSSYALVGLPDLHVLAGLIVAKLPAGWQAAVSDAVHGIIARSDHQDVVTGTELPSVQRQRAGPGGVFEFIDSEGRASLEAYMRSELTGWETAVWAPKALLEAPVRALWWTMVLTALFACALVIGLALWLARIIANSVGHAARAATALGKGGPLPLSGTAVAEVNTLMAELRESAARRQAAEQDLQASKDQLQVSKDQLQVSKDQLEVSKDRLQLAFDATHLGWWQYDPRRATVTGDARFKEIFDVSVDEISIDDLIRRVHPDDMEMFRTNREAALDPANPESYVHHEYRVRRRDGPVRWVEGNALAYFQGVGRERQVVSFSGTVQDITERKEREEKEHLLMREINHRAKNMLSVVDAIAHQTATRSPEDFIECFSERIQALSANQDLLVRSEWKGVEIADLVRAQLAPFADLIGSRIVMQGRTLHLNPASAQAIGLALHELATNAGKYGALSTDKGRVDICWGTDDNNFTMRWIEHGGPPVSVPERRGFGTVVMEAMTARSVRGHVDLDYASSGVNWRLTCPAANVFESGG